jgi:2,4-dienoyl-CoA reductase-like NADH-dependent reductase (Old Yellow Enzyme family)
MSALFDELQLREVTLRNRIVVSPMCEYSADEGVPNDWHLVHLGSRAVGGAALVITEATAVEAAGRISPGDTGIYNDAQTEAWARVVRFVKGEGAAAGIQLAHAGRKASTAVPWSGGGPLTVAEGGWRPIYSASALPFKPDWITPEALDEAGIRRTVGLFRDAARRSLEAGFDVVEIHAAHGYLIHQFYSPLSNKRTDDYGVSFGNRTRLLREVVDGVREVWPERLPLFVRISSTDWVEGGWTAEDSVQLAPDLKARGVDLIDCSSGGNVPDATIPVGPGYQVPFAAKLRAEAGIKTGAVGMITEPGQAEEIVGSGQADVVLLARELLRDPYWARRAASELGVKIAPPRQYGRAW